MDDRKRLQKDLKTELHHLAKIKKLPFTPAIRREKKALQKSIKRFCMQLQASEERERY